MKARSIGRPGSNCRLICLWSPNHGFYFSFLLFGTRRLRIAFGPRYKTTLEIK